MKYLITGGKWLLQILLAFVMMVPGGITKFTSPNWERMFRVWGYPDGLYLVIGAIELTGGALLLVPKLASYSAAMLMVVMTGAAATQILRGGRNGVGELVLVALLGVICVTRWRDRWRSRRSASSPAPA
jgi:uncharacterized membrane protein YphA (DoxX/SURF4 family)